jgi:signal transduction histidine kinase
VNALQHEISARFLAPLLTIAAPYADELRDFLRGWEVNTTTLADQTNWVSLRFCEAFSEWLAARVGVEPLAERVTELTFSSAAFGFMYPWLRAFGSPDVGYASLPTFIGKLNKVSVVSVHSLGRRRAEIEYRPAAPEFAEQSPLICRLRRAQLAAAPTLWGLPTAQVEEVECQSKGAGRCVYRLRWVGRSHYWLALAGGALGLGAGLLAGGIVPAAMAATSGVLLGHAWQRRRQVRELTAFNDEQTAALAEAIAANERHFIESTHAKAEVDRQVAERTFELEGALERLETLSRVKDEFLANVSHELRTPLSLILGPVEQLLRSAPPSARAALGTAHRNATLLQQRLNDLLDLARLRAGQLELVRSELDLRPFVEDLLLTYREAATHKGVGLTLVAPQSVRIWADSHRLAVTVCNLLSNAVKFTPRGGAIEISISSDDDFARVAVRDTGPGIRLEHQDLVFERFRRFEAPGQAGGAGTGIGLAMVKELVELHGGRVELISSEGAGSTFTLILPRNQPAAAIPVVELPALVESNGKPATRRPDVPRVLVVDDNADMREFTASVLSERYQVDAVASGEAALAWLETNGVDVVLSDVMMPGMTGYELCRKVKTERPQLAMLLVTARREINSTLEGFDCGADDYLVKPFHATELIARIDVQLRMRRLVSEVAAREKLALLGSLAAGFAHEVKNPVSAILAGLPGLRRDLVELGASEAARHMTDVAIECAERIARLANDLLVLGQPERGNAGRAPWDLHVGLEAAVDILAHRLPPGVVVTKNLCDNARVLADPARVSQILVNIVDNAIRAVGMSGSIEITTARIGGQVELRISDSGEGIPDAIAPRIFDAFFTTRALGEGTGLGLHLARNLARSQGGNLELVRGGLSGACFRLSLPRADE